MSKRSIRSYNTRAAFLKRERERYGIYTFGDKVANVLKLRNAEPGRSISWIGDMAYVEYKEVCDILYNNGIVNDYIMGYGKHLGCDWAKNQAE